MEATGTLSGLLYYYKSKTHNQHVQIEPQDPAKLVADLIAGLPAGLCKNSKITVMSDLDEAPGLWFYHKT